MCPIQKKVRFFLARRRDKYSSYESYLETKSRIIVTQLKHFYTIHSKFDKLKRRGGNAEKADKQMRIVEKVFAQL